ncbi:MAG: hypothetical protein ACK5HY_07285 [Parahaliea sp.]
MAIRKANVKASPGCALWGIVCLAILVVAPLVEAAPEVLFLSTSETEPDAVNLTNLMYNAFDSDSRVIRLDGMVNGIGWLGNAQATDGVTTLDASDFNGIRIVIVLSVYGRMDPDAIPILGQVILNRPDLRFIFFVDGCCRLNDPPAINVTPIVSILNDGTGWNLGQTDHIAPEDYSINTALNTASPYSGSFAALDPLAGEYYQNITNVPVENVLYLPKGVTTIPPGSDRASAYSLLIPGRQLNGGTGACVILTADASPFFNTGSNAVKASTFMAAALDAGGSCQARRYAAAQPVPTLGHVLFLLILLLPLLACWRLRDRLHRKGLPAI